MLILLPSLYSTDMVSMWRDCHSELTKELWAMEKWFYDKAGNRKVVSPLRIWARSVFPLCHLFWEDIFSTRATLGLGFSSLHEEYEVWFLPFFPLFYLVTLQMFPNHESDTVTNSLFFYSYITTPKLRKFQEAVSGKRGKWKERANTLAPDFYCIHL